MVTMVRTTGPRLSVKSADEGRLGAHTTLMSEVAWSSRLAEHDGDDGEDRIDNDGPAQLQIPPGKKKMNFN